MGSVITGILTDVRLRSDQAVHDGLVANAKAGAAWGSEV